MDRATLPPAETKLVVEFFEEHNLWHNLSRNGTHDAIDRFARSCRDAASKRNRLGATGISVYDELKSAVMVTDSGRVVAVHCRGHHTLDDQLVALAIGEPVRRMSAETMAEELRLSYGLVNPFYLYKKGVEQVIDSAVLRRYYPPHTMTTNAGHAEWAVEFDVGQLVARLPSFGTVADVAAWRGAAAPDREPVLGILTGNAPESGILLWEAVIRAIRTRLPKWTHGDTGFPRFVIESLPEMGLSMELSLRKPYVEEVVLRGINQLCDAGATVIAIACNTTQYFAPHLKRVCEERGVEFVSLVDEVDVKLRELGVLEADLFAIGAVSDLEGLSDFRRLGSSVTLHRADPGGAAEIEDLAWDIKRMGATPGNIQKFQQLVKRLAKSDTVVLALTELSLVYEAQNEKQRRRWSVEVLDTVEILATAMAGRYVDERLRFERAGMDDASDGSGGRARTYD